MRLLLLRWFRHMALMHHGGMGKYRHAFGKINLFVATGGPVDLPESVHFYGSDFFRGTCSCNRARIPTPIHHYNPCTAWNPIRGYAKIHISYKWILHWELRGRILPLHELVCIEKSYYGQIVANHRHGVPFNDGSDGVPWYLTSLADIVHKYIIQSSWWNYPRDFNNHHRPTSDNPYGMYADVLLDKPGTVRYFKTSTDKLYMSIEPDYMLGKSKITDYREYKNPPPRELHSGKLPDSFKGLFTVVESNKKYYVTTTAGHVYMVTIEPKSLLDVKQV